MSGMSVPRAPVTPDTLFAVGSITKSFTVVGLAMLADEGRLDWDAPVSRYLPEFRLAHDPPARPVTTRDLVSHRTGSARHDSLWYLHAFSRKELVRRVQLLRPFAPPGLAFQYNNVMVMVGGHIAGRLAQVPWETFTRRRILEPLGMTETRLTLAAFCNPGTVRAATSPAI